MNIDNRFTASLHTHVRSIFDAQIDAKVLCEKIKELGGKGCAITDHGVLTSIEDYRRVFEAEELKMIPGVELYVDGGILGRLHLILLAKNFLGYKGICKIVTSSNRTMQGDFPVISQETLFEIVKDYRGNIFALSACMQGVICATFLLNNAVDKKIEKLRKKQEKYLSPNDPKVKATAEKVDECRQKVALLTEKRDVAKLWADKKYTQREKALKQLFGDELKAAEQSLEKDKQISQKAKEALPQKKEELKLAQKELSAAQKEMKTLSESLEMFGAIEEEIGQVKKELKNEETLYETAIDTALKYQEAFGKGRFLAEVQYHGIPEEKVCFPKLVKVANELRIPLVATNDVHILTNSEDDRLRRQILRSLRFGSCFEEESVGDSELYLKDNNELFEALRQIISEEDAEKAIKNIDVVFNACDVVFETGKHYPKFIE